MSCTAVHLYTTTTTTTTGLLHPDIYLQPKYRAVQGSACYICVSSMTHYIYASSTTKSVPRLFFYIFLNTLQFPSTQNSPLYCSSYKALLTFWIWDTFSLVCSQPKGRGEIFVKLKVWLEAGSLLDPFDFILRAFSTQAAWPSQRWLDSAWASVL